MGTTWAADSWAADSWGPGTWADLGDAPAVTTGVEECLTGADRSLVSLTGADRSVVAWGADLTC